jgi:redox-sensitive bicupin YhaK (pirin superfamily)
MADSPILEQFALGFPWQTANPFLFCVHHEDFYPAGNAQLGPQASLAGRNLGQDFTIKDGFRMYHGETVPGFPGHPHRGFETITVVQTGVVDHADSQGAAGRYGGGDVQWMTAGSGLQHSEMFPLLKQDQDNPLELFQIWLNLPRAKKMVAPHFAMLWADTIPIYTERDTHGRQTQVKLIAGQLGDIKAPPPAPDSWAADPANGVAVWTMSMEPGAQWTLPAADPEFNRVLYFFAGQTLKVAGQTVKLKHGVALDASAEVLLENGPQPAKLLLLQGRPIDEPVAQHGPFVMNSQQEIRQAFVDYQRTQFGGWPWPSYDHTHPPERGRFARYADGREEEHGSLDGG